MEIYDEFLAEQVRSKKCGLGDALRSMDKPTRKGTIAALHDPNINAVAITDVLKRKNYRVNEWQVRKCRKCCDCGAIKEV